MTFATKTLARRWLATVEADMARGVWRDPAAETARVASYGRLWIAQRDLSVRTRELYEGLLRLHLEPELGELPLAEVSPARVRAWRQRLLDTGTGASTVSKSYRLLPGILNTAVDDELIVRNPCRIKGAGVEPTPERPVITLPQVFILAEAMPPRFRCFVLLAVFGSLRWGELMGLQRRDIDLAADVVRVERAVVETKSGLVTKAPKSAAGVRSIAIPSWLARELALHLELFAEAGPEGRVFVGEKGATPSRRNFGPMWRRAKAAAGAGIPENLHFHDLRHTGSHLAAETGATTRELMGRLGHASMRAALIYQHRTADRDRAIASSLDEMIRRVLGT